MAIRFLCTHCERSTSSIAQLFEHYDDAHPDRPKTALEARERPLAGAAWDGRKARYQGRRGLA